MSTLVFTQEKPWIRNTAKEGVKWEGRRVGRGVESNEGKGQGGRGAEIIPGPSDPFRREITVGGREENQREARK